MEHVKMYVLLNFLIFHLHINFPGYHVLDPEANSQESVALSMRGILLRDFIALFSSKTTAYWRWLWNRFLQSYTSHKFLQCWMFLLYIIQMLFFSSLFPNVSNFGRGVGEGDIEDGGHKWSLKQMVATRELVDSPSFFWILVKSFYGLMHFHSVPSLQPLLRRKRKDGMLMSGTAWHSCLGSITFWREMLTSP